MRKGSGARGRGSAKSMLALFSILLGGCTYTVAGSKPVAPLPPAPRYHARVEYSVGDFTFALNQREPKPSHFDAHRLANELMRGWEQRGYVREARFVDEKAFTGNADYQVLLTGSQHGETSLTAQIFNALTLMLLPYSVTETYDLHLAVEDMRGKKRYDAHVVATDKTWVEILLILAVPWAERGHREEMHFAGDQLFAQLIEAGAFQDEVESPGLGPW